MKPNISRRNVLAGLCALALAGCADVQWFKMGPPAKAYGWAHVPRKTMIEVCYGRPYNPAEDDDTAMGGCMVTAFGAEQCTIASIFTEEEARTRYVHDDLSLFEHEVWNKDKTKGHCAGYHHDPIRMKPRRLNGKD